MNLHEIKARLAKATQKRWRTQTRAVSVVIAPAGGAEYSTFVEGAAGHLQFSAKDARDVHPDADLIAHAPTDLTALVARVEALEAENARLRDSLFDMVGQFACPTSQGLTTGGLSALELAFETLGLPNPCPPETLRDAALPSEVTNA